MQQERKKGKKEQGLGVLVRGEREDITMGKRIRKRENGRSDVLFRPSCTAQNQKTLPHSKLCEAIEERKGKGAEERQLKGG